VNWEEYQLDWPLLATGSAAILFFFGSFFVVLLW
jgi:hypothetical protein